MDNDKIIEVLSSWNLWERDGDVGIYRDNHLAKLDKLLLTDQVVAITGVRRGGKSTLMKQFIQKQITKGKDRKSFLYINFEEPRFVDLLSLEFLQQIYDAYMEIVGPTDIPYILLDEVQNVPQWERFVRSLHEKKAAHIIISGSTSKLLSKEIGSLLTGRWVELKLSPLTFKEFLSFNGLEITDRLGMLSQKNRIRQLLREYMEYGGFPLVVLKEEKKDILGKYFDDIVGRDVAQRYKVRNLAKLISLAKYYLTNSSSHISYRRIAKFLGLSLDSVERFSSYFTEAYLTFFVSKFAYSLKEQETNPRVVYGIDAGLINIVGFRFSENIGKLYENLVFLSLLQKGKEIYYYKGRNECDFVIKEGQKIVQALQVSYQVKENKERELAGLLEAMVALGLKQGVVVTDDYEAEEEIKSDNGVYSVKFVPLWKWLLSD